MERYVTIHGHFYQPPRENAWLEAVEVQDSAYPFHDWNERITRQCYAPNCAARVLDGQGRIARLLNNYTRISFNFGPTLLAWLQENSPETYRAILDADQESQRFFSGHGSGLAQAYNHLILPLANRRDKQTQIIWGIKDFTHRFGRHPEGLWLPETAVDLETLEILAAQGIRFTLLAPSQAHQIKTKHDRNWVDVGGEKIDPSRAYRLSLASGLFIDLFFYDGPISRGVAFENLLNNGQQFAGRLLGAFSDTRKGAQLVHIATDGETYGHHHLRGEMALAYALDVIQASSQARLTNYGEFLERHPPEHEVRIFENSSWSCPHGVERWRSACGCNSGANPGWNQAWRAPLRESLDWLRDRLARPFEARGRRFFKDPWAARDDYISVILDRSPENVRSFLLRHCGRDLAERDRVTALKLLEAQRHALLMYTSCGWFFDELSGLETVQVLQYAGRAIQLSGEILEDRTLEAHFLEKLHRAKSNIPEHRDGRAIYLKWVKPAQVDLKRVAVHYAARSLFEPYAKRDRIYCYKADQGDFTATETGQVRMALGKVRFTSRITLESALLSFGALHFGDYNLSGGVREFPGDEAYQSMVAEAGQAFARADIAAILRLLDRGFGQNIFSVHSLFRDEQRKVLQRILEASRKEADTAYLQLYRSQAPLMRFLSDLGSPIPRFFQANAEKALNSSLRQALESAGKDNQPIRALLAEAGDFKISLDEVALAHSFNQRTGTVSDQFKANPLDMGILGELASLADLGGSLPFEVDLWKPQNVYFQVFSRVYPQAREKAAEGDPTARAWMASFLSLGEKLSCRPREVGKEAEEKEQSMESEFSAMADKFLAACRIPRAVYRVQFGPGFTFRQALDLVPYWSDLGISDLYVSPVFRTCSDNGAGYDICDHRQLNPALGTPDDFDALAKALQEREMGLILDVVPNHMGISRGNPWWTDVLENGPSSPFSCYFDIDFHPSKPELENKVLLPILGDAYGKVLETGKFSLSVEEGAFYLNYYDYKLPVAPRTYFKILQSPVEAVSASLSRENIHVQELQSILTAIGYLPPVNEIVPEKLEEQKREKEVIKRRIGSVYRGCPEFRAALDETIRGFNGSTGEPSSFDRLDDLLSAQIYRPTYWRVAADEINYRRFFDINELAAIRMELPPVFEETHRLLFRLLAEGKVTGVRVDHPDGLWNPRRYLHQLQKGYLLAKARTLLPDRLPPGQSSPSEALDDAVESWLAGKGRPGPDPVWPLYVVVEKILGPEEPLAEDWEIYGTTGYDFLNLVNCLFVDGGNGKILEGIYSYFTGTQAHFANLVNSSKKMIMLISLASEVAALSHQLERISEKNRLYRDLTLNSLTFALREVIAGLPVYRTYISGPEDVPARDREYIEKAVAEAKRRNPRTAVAVFDFIRDCLLLDNLQHFHEEDRSKLVRFVMQCQQVTGPVMAKGLEDTAFYNYHRLVSLNEVGGRPDQFGVPVAEFHRQNRERREKWPHSLLATSTHDTKRSEDVRARINVLSEIPGEWRSTLSRWSRFNAAKKTSVEGQPAPDRNDEYLLYQTLVGAWPVDSPSLLPPERLQTFRQRITAYMEKATLEAKAHTSWVNRNEEYDAAVRNFVLRVLENRGKNRFLSDLDALSRKVAYFGRLNALAQLLLKLTCPGVPDIYQGTEIWDDSLVDPDNRRAVDYELRRSLLQGLKTFQETASGDLALRVRELVEKGEDGRVKIYLLYRTLNFRRDHPSIFSEGDYQPLPAEGSLSENLCGFARSTGQDRIVVACPRLAIRATGGKEQLPVGEEIWKDTRLNLPPEWETCRFTNLYTGEEISNPQSRIPAADIFRHVPFALLHQSN